MPVEQYENYCRCQNCGYVGKGETFPKIYPTIPDCDDSACPQCKVVEEFMAAGKDDVDEYQHPDWFCPACGIRKEHPAATKCDSCLEDDRQLEEDLDCEMELDRQEWEHDQTNNGGKQ